MPEGRSAQDLPSFEYSRTLAACEDLRDFLKAVIESKRGDKALLNRLKAVSSRGYESLEEVVAIAKETGFNFTSIDLRNVEEEFQRGWSDWVVPLDLKELDIEIAYEYEWIDSESDYINRFDEYGELPGPMNWIEEYDWLDWIDGEPVKSYSQIINRTTFPSTPIGHLMNS